MRCTVESCDISDDHFLWKCEYCEKHFHAACIGVQRHQERSITSFMIPLCADCQQHLNAGIDTQKVLYRQEQLIDSITSQTDANLQVAADLKKLNEFAIGPLFDNIELQLKESVTNVNINTASKLENAVSTLTRDIAQNSIKSDELVALKNHLTTLFDISMQTTRKRIEEHVKELTVDLSRELAKIRAEVENLSGVTIDMASHCNEHNDSQSHSTVDALHEVKSLTNTVGGEILKEVKSLGIAVNGLENSISKIRLPPEASPPSLMDELAEQSTNESTEGWRTLGSKKVWRSDWTEYDSRKRLREQQQKARAKAIKRKKAIKRQWNIKNNFNTNSNSNQDNTNEIVPTCSYYNYNSSSSSNNTNRNSHQTGTSFLPPDKDLLAAAKVQFSRPPVENQRGIRFQRGVTLNPYPVDHQLPQPNSTSTQAEYRQARQFEDGETRNPYPTNGHGNAQWMAPGSSTTSCEACTCRHSCFPKN